MLRKTTRNVKLDGINGFGSRLKEAFDNKQNSEIAKLLEVSDSAITTYINGRVPAANKLIEIARLTGCNLHWLLTGEGEKEFFGFKKPTTLIFHGSGGGLGTTTASVVTSLILSAKGKNVLLVENGMGMCLRLLVSSDKKESKQKDNEKNRRKSAELALARQIKTVFQNIDIFIPTSMNVGEKYRDKLETFPTKMEKISSQYDYIIFDAFGHSDPFDEYNVWKDTFALKEFYINAKVIISCQPYYYSPIESIQDTLKYIENAKDDFPDITLLGIFINHLSPRINTGPQAFKKLYREISDFAGSKLLKTVIDRDVNAALLMTKNIKEFARQKSTLLNNYKSLVNEIEERIAANNNILNENF